MHGPAAINPSRLGSPSAKSFTIHIIVIGRIPHAPRLATLSCDPIINLVIDKRLTFDGQTVMTDQNPTVDPEVRNRHQRADKYGTKFIDKTEKLQEKAADHKLGAVASKQPAGGFDDTPVPHAPPGYTLKITFHRATNLPCADISSLSADPFVVSVIKTNLQKRHKEDPDLVFRTPTVHKNTSPEWNVSWIIANVPKSGFNMKCRLYDEDPSDHDDRLGNVHVNIDHMEDDWPGIREQEYKIKKRMGSKRAYLVRGIAAVLRKDVEMSGSLVISIESLGKTGGDEGGRAYTTGPLAWSRHFSPLIGRLVGTKDDAEEGTPDANGKVQKYKCVVGSSCMRPKTDREAASKQCKCNFKDPFLLLYAPSLPALS